MNSPKIFDQITQGILAKIDQGVRPWAKPWSESRVPMDEIMPRNIDGRGYRGANVFWLMLAQQSAGYAHPVWLTYNQADKLGGNVRKGEHGCPVFFWKFGQTKDEGSDKVKSWCMVKPYTVFNIGQCEGVELPPPPPPKPEPERIAAAESMIEATGARIVHAGTRAFYSPAFDQVQLPPRAAFLDSDGYYGTAFHELGHWTGHEKRLDRKFGKRFGDDAYAMEELVAELTAAFVCGAHGFASLERDDHAAYLAHWSRVMKADSRAFITAASAAQKAAEYIIKGGDSAASEAEPSAEEVAQAA